MVTTDGPFEEQPGGFWVVEAADLALVGNAAERRFLEQRRRSVAVA